MASNECPLRGRFHWPVIFIVALQNETRTVERNSRAQTEENQYSNIRGTLIGPSLLSGVTEEQLHLSEEFNCET